MGHSGLLHRERRNPNLSAAAAGERLEVMKSVLSSPPPTLVGGLQEVIAGLRSAVAGLQGELGHLGGRRRHQGTPIGRAHRARRHVPPGLIACQAMRSTLLAAG
jgi:hypothetical protein